MSEAAATDWGLNMRLGNQWFDLSVGSDPDLDKLTKQVDARIGREPRLLDSRQKLIDMLAYFSRDAASRGAAAGAIRWALDELDGVSVATLYTRVYKDAQVREPDDTLGFLEARMAPQHGSDLGEPSVEVRELTAGKALRVQVISQATEEAAPQGDGANGGSASDERRTLLQETVQYWLPIPGQPFTVVFTLSTPNLAGAEEIVAELDQIIESLSIRG